MSACLNRIMEENRHNTLTRVPGDIGNGLKKVHLVEQTRLPAPILVLFCAYFSTFGGKDVNYDHFSCSHHKNHNLISIQ